MALDLNGTTGASAVQNGIVSAAKLDGAQSGSPPVFGARAWCVFDGTLAGTNAPTAGGNVTSVTRNGAGDYTINFTVALPDANYATLALACQAVPTNVLLSQLQGTTPTTTAVRVLTLNSTFTATDGKVVSVVVLR